MDCQKLIPAPPHTWTYCRSTRGLCLQQVLHRRGLQQNTNQRWGPTQSRIQDKVQPLQAHGHVLWSMQLPSHIPKHDEPHLPAIEGQVGKKRSQNHHLYGWYSNSYVHFASGSQRHYTWRSRPPTRTQPVPQKEEVPMGGWQHQLSGANPWKGGDMHGPDQSGGHQKLADVTDAHILSYFSVFYTDLFDEVFVIWVLIINDDKMVSHVLPPCA